MLSLVKNVIGGKKAGQVMKVKKVKKVKILEPKEEVKKHSKLWRKLSLRKQTRARALSNKMRKRKMKK